MGLYLIIVLFFCIYFFILEFRFDNAFKEFEEEYFIKIISTKEDGNYTDKYVGKILYGKNKNFRVYLYLKKENSFNYGDILKVKGEVELPDKARNDKGFDYSKYLKTKKIVASIFAEKADFIVKQQGSGDLTHSFSCEVGQVLIKRENDFISIIYDIKMKCINIIDKNFTGQKSEVLKAILLGERGGISEETNEIFSKSNLSHILAISGLHVTYVCFYFEQILKRVVNSIKLRNFCLIVFLIIFIFFVGTSPSVMRACIMMIICYIGKNFLREKDFYISFFISLIIILLVNPYNVYSISMWLSFLGSLGIVLFSNFIQKIVIKKCKIKSKFVKAILEVVVVSFSAQILIFPIMWKNFGTVSLSFFVSNLLVTELIAPILVIGYMSIFIFPIRDFIVFIENILLDVFLKLVLISSKIPFNQFYLPTPSNFTIFTYYLLILALICFYRKNRWKFLKCILNFNYMKSKIKRFLGTHSQSFIAKAGVALIILIFVSNIIYFSSKDLKINFLDVGQGDCTLIRTKYNKVVLIDSGEGHSEKYDYGKSVVISYLMAHKVSKIDFLIISHFDSDHCGGAFYLLENMKLENVVIGVQAEKYQNCVDFIKIAKRKNVNIIVLKSGDTLNIDKETFFEILFPDEKNTISENKINNNSLVMKLYYNSFSMLFTGDIEKEGEQAILEKYSNKLQSTVLKVAHHGSKTSSTKEFLENVKPQIVVIGVGKKNTFGHPNKEVLERFKKFNAKIYRTDENGEIMIQTNGDKIKVNCKF